MAGAAVGRADQEVHGPGWSGLPRPLRWTAYSALALALVLVVVGLSGVWVARRPLPQTTGSLTLPGLRGPVDVLRDGWGIPQIYADTTADLMRAQGYVHAQDRFYEMDVRRHVTAGRLSELFGDATLDIDTTVRTMGWRQVARRSLALVSPDTRAALDAYADGVNAYLADRPLSQVSLEYSLLTATGLDYHVEPWTSLDSMAWLQAMAWDLRGNMDDEIARALLAADHTPAQVAELWPDYPYADHAPILGTGSVRDGTFDPAVARVAGRGGPGLPGGSEPAFMRAASALAAVPTTLTGPGGSRARGGLGSNSWVVSGDLTTTREPLLANDPHLGVSLPGIWTQVGLHCRTVGPACPYDVTGFSFSGFPGVVIGHNADVAWGFTNLDPDVSDLYLERVRGDRWLHAGRWRPLALREETILVRGGDDVRLTVRSTAHGPILSDASQELASVGANARPRVPPGGEDEELPGTGYAVSLAWTGLQPSRTAEAVLGFDRATDWKDFRTAARLFAVPAQNLVYADTAGHIGYQAPGRIPIRRPGNDGSVPSAGWLPRNDWTGRYVPFRALPWALDPADGFVATANQAVTGPGYPYHLTDTFDLGYRSQRIRDRLEELTAGGRRLDADDLLALQLDTRTALADVLVPRLLAIRLPGGYDRDGQDLLRGWDHRMDADSGAAAYFAVVWRRLLALTFHDEMRRSQWPDGEDRWFAVVADLLDEPDSSWWDDRGTDDVVEDRDDVLRTALLEARVEITQRISLDPSRWTWGRLHRLDLRSSTLGESGNRAVERLFNRGGWQVGGSTSVVDALAWDAAAGYDVVSGPSMRMVVDLSDLDASRWVNLTGASGHPLSGHYTDQTEVYVEGRTLPWVFGAEAVEDQPDLGRLRLVPVGAAPTG